MGKGISYVDGKCYSTRSESVLLSHLLSGAKLVRQAKQSRSGGQQLLSVDELCDTLPGVLFQYSRGVGKRPLGSAVFIISERWRAAGQCCSSQLKENGEEEKFTQPLQKRKRECGVCIIYFEPDQRGAGKAPHKGHITSSLTRFSYNCRRWEKSAKFRGSSQCGPWWILQHAVP